MSIVPKAASGDSVTVVKQEVVKAGRALFECGFHAALAGNLSARVGKNLIVCTPHGAHKGSMTTEELLVCNMRGEVVEGHGRPTSEIHMHLAAYCDRPEVGAVIHAHPPVATAFAAASLPLDGLMLPEMLVWLGPIALVPYATPGTDELAAQLRPFLAGNDAFLLENHGALSLGSNLQQAAQRMELIEQTARITLSIHQLARQPFVLNACQVDELDSLRRRLSSGVS